MDYWTCRGQIPGYLCIPDMVWCWSDGGMDDEDEDVGSVRDGERVVVLVA